MYISDKIMDKVKLSDKIWNYFNTGYCKFEKAQEGCRFKQPTEEGKKPICKDNFFQKCRNGDKCFYKHNSKFKTNPISKD